MFAAPLFALDKTNPAPVDPPDARQRLSVVDEVIRMAQAGVGDDAIISYVRSVREPFAVTSDDLIALTNARVSNRVIREMQNDSQDRRYTTRSTVLVSPYAYPYYGYPYPYGYYSPYWYGPRLSFGIFIGPRFGGFRHRW